MIRFASIVESQVIMLVSVPSLEKLLVLGYVLNVGLITTPPRTAEQKSLKVI